MIENSYYYFKNAIPSNVCNNIIDLGLKSKIKKSLTLKEANYGIKDESRDSLNGELTNQWIYDMLYPYLDEANKSAGWNFEVDWSETLQFTVYKEGGHYHWHRDAGIDSSYAYKEDRGENFKGKIRKISMTLLLNDPKNFEGGDLEFDYGRNDLGETEGTIEICKEARSQGTLIFFPSFINHRVTPVKKGTRYSLVMWTIGQPFK